MATFIFYDDMLVNVLLKNAKPSGGAAVQSYAWIRGLMEEGHEVMALTNKANPKEIHEDCIDIKRIDLYDADKGIRWIRWIYYRLPYLLRIIKKNNPDYFCQGIPNWTSAFFGLISFLLGVKFIIRVSCDHLIDNRFFQFHGKLHHILQGTGFSMAFAIICQNDYQYEILKGRYPQKKIIKFGNPFYNKPLDRISDYAAREYIAWVGLFQYQKNMRLLFEIASTLKHESFRIAGSSCISNLDEETIECTAKLKTLSNVEFVGYLNRDDLIGFLNNAKFLLSTSRYEGFSNTFLEAMFCGTPVITTGNANPDSIIEKFNVGLLYTDSRDLEEKISVITKEQFDIMSANALDYINAYHNYRTLAKKLVRFLEPNRKLTK